LLWSSTGYLRPDMSCDMSASLEYLLGLVHISQLVPLGLNRVVLFEVVCCDLGIIPTVTLLRVFLTLCKQGDWFSFAKRRNIEYICMDEGLLCLKGWKKNFFLIDRRVISDHLTWRSSQSCVTDDFPTYGYDQRDVERLCANVICLCEMKEAVLVRSYLSSCWRNKECKRSKNGDRSVNSKPSVTELYAVNDEAFMVDKKYVNVTDLNVASVEKGLVSDRVDLEKKTDDVQVLDNVVCVEHTKINDVTILDNVVCADPNKFLIEFKDVYRSEAKTSAAVDSDVKNKFNVYDEDDDVVADENVDIADNFVFVSDKKSIMSDEEVDYCEKNYVCSDANVSASGDADMHNYHDTLKFAASADTIGVSDTK
ncbi:hypothetical protein Tco_0987234, partial [Tanacetum coccineum]